MRYRVYVLCAMEGQLLSSREWQITFPEKPQPQTEPKEEPMSAEDEQAKENVMAFLDSFGVHDDTI